jgi:hypothetical protein
MQNSEINQLATYNVDEAGDGILFGRKGRIRLYEPDSSKFFILGMIRCEQDERVASSLYELRTKILSNPLYSGIPSAQEDAGKTAKFFHAKDDHPEIRAKVFEWLTMVDFRFYAVVKEMKKVLEYVKSRNQMDSSYRYHPNELYDLSTRMLFKQRLHKESRYKVIFARRGKSDRTIALKEQLVKTRENFLLENKNRGQTKAELEIQPAYPWEETCLQIADYSLWAVQRCYERGEDRFLNAIWPKVSLIHDVDDTAKKVYGKYYTRKTKLPDQQSNHSGAYLGTCQ